MTIGHILTVNGGRAFTSGLIVG